MFIGKKASIVWRCVMLLLLINPVSVVIAQTDSVARSYPPPGQLVDLGGWKLHLYGQGTTVEPGPTVIFESGAGGFSFDWSLVQPQVASFARAYAYDRAGSAWSELGPRPHTMHQTVYNLHTLLQQAKIPGPYVLVGASHGGVLVRLFAEHYPTEVAGMVLVDSGIENGLTYINGKLTRPGTEGNNQPVPPVKERATSADNELAQTPEARKIIDDALAKAGLSVASMKLNPAYSQLPDSARKFRLWATRRYEYFAANDNNHYLDELAGMIVYREKNPQFLGAIPLIVLTRGKRESSDSDEREEERKRGQAALQNLSSNSKQIIAQQSGHHIEVDDPGLVAEAIREVVEAVRQNKRLTH